MVNYYGHKIDWVPILEENKKAIYIKIADSIEADIKSGKLPTGYKLPPQRVIANYLGVNHSTVTKAYKHCESKGLIDGIVGKGTFVKNTAGVLRNLFLKERNDIIDLAMLFPMYETNDTLGEMFNELTPYFDRDIMYKYSGASGHIKHKYIASNWLKKLNLHVLPERIVITSGAQNGLYTVLKTEFHFGDKIAVDELTYTGLIESATQLGIKLIPIRSDGDGMLADELLIAIKKHNISAIYLIPDCHNPTALNMPLSRRLEIADLIKEHKLLIIEESLFRFTADLSIPSFYSLLPKNCYHIASISKMINPGFRIAYLLLPEDAILEVIEHTLHNLIFMPSSMTAEILSCLQSSNKLDELLQLRKRLLEEKNEIFDEVFKNFNIAGNGKSMFRFIELDDEKVRNLNIESIFLEEGVRIYSADRFRVLDSVGIQGIRISISSSESDDKLREELEIVRNIIEKRFM